MNSVRTTNRLSVLMIVIAAFTLLTVFTSLLISASSHAISVKDLAGTVFPNSHTQRPAVIGMSTSTQVASLTPGVVVSPTQQAALQSKDTVGSVVTYPSAQIDASKRDQLFTVALSIIIIGMSLYGMTLFRAIPPAPVSVVHRRPLYNVNVAAHR